MTGARQPEGFYSFDLGRGVVLGGQEASTNHSSRMMVVTDGLMRDLVSAAVHSGDLSALRHFGRQLGEQSLRFLEGDAVGFSSADPSAAVYAIRSVVALFGFGHFGLERWGDALVARLGGAPELDGDRLGLGALLGGMFSVLTGNEVACVPTPEEDAFVLVDPSVADDVWGMSRAHGELGALIGGLAQ